MDDDKDIGITVLAVIGIILPLAGFLWGPGAWWQYALWLIGGCVVVALAVHFSEERERPPS